MQVTYSAQSDTAKSEALLTEYRTYIQGLVRAKDFSRPESALLTWQDDLMRTGVADVVQKLGPVSHVVLIGTGGSSLGVEAIHAAGKSDVTLHVLDAVSPHALNQTIKALAGTTPEKIAVCVISKSGGTTETLVNATVFLEALAGLYGNIRMPHDRVVCIGDEGNALLTAGAALGMHVLPMHKSVGGRYSVFTAVGLVALALLGHNTDEILDGLKASGDEPTDQTAAVGAVRLHQELQNGVRSVNFFAFNKRLEKLGYWWRQLTAESLGKETDIDGNPVTLGFIPTISTPVELHSIGQLYFSGFGGVYTDFVAHTDLHGDFTVPKDTTLAPQFAARRTEEIHNAIMGGVIGAYDTQKLPYRVTRLDESELYALGLFMGARMRETMYLAKLMKVNAFDQPNVELYKTITRDILNGDRV